MIACDFKHLLIGAGSVEDLNADIMSDESETLAENWTPEEIKKIYRRAWGAVKRKNIPHHDAEDIVHSTVLKWLADARTDTYDSAWNAANHWRRSRSRKAHILRYLRNRTGAGSEIDRLMIRLDMRDAVVQLSRNEIRVIANRFWKDMAVRKFSGWDKKQNQVAINNLRHLLASYREEPRPMDPIPVNEGSQTLSSLLQIAINEIAVGRIDIAISLIQAVITQLQGSGQ